MGSCYANCGANTYFKYNTAPEPVKRYALNCKVQREEERESNRHMLARVTVYWSLGGGTDSWTRHRQTSSGLPLIDGESIAVDPKLIPYGSTVSIPGYGTAKAVDTGSAVISRRASKLEGKHNPVVDLYFERREDAARWEKSNPEYVQITLL